MLQQELKNEKNTRQVKETNVEREDRGRNEIYAR